MDHAFVIFSKHVPVYFPNKGGMVHKSSLESEAEGYTVKALRAQPGGGNNSFIHHSPSRNLRYFSFASRLTTFFKDAKEDLLPV